MPREIDGQRDPARAEIGLGAWVIDPARRLCESADLPSLGFEANALGFL